ncbi:Golgi apparatus membrane protein TVP38 [Colletotrichum sp. SAR 10_99]|nr:Golgi apparatus membrane protein TVP38 [Colletotrichum sp. SAR 10_75]KAI8242553.1 Golgi apparatus membrane protein TVP38 [Colletotrichum sp. SAR 10_96]KAI8286654.1 Golgi apparatus membrane protein TVP38 [Colletotrichum sp. SAR 10_98]KAJ5015362.1 Golgi apparatus membrane protein TVP38 [Colletotrichum sp. SAR 10_99]
MPDVEMARRNGERKDEVPEFTEYRPLNWKKIFLTPKYIPFHLLGIGILVATIFISLHHDEVVEKLRPFSEKVREIPGGFLIPIAILILISFPPLFGHEIVALLCGVVYGLWVGFAIVAAGTFIGEIGTWFAFKYTLRRKAQKLERTNLNYGALARLTRDGGFWIVFIIRFSVIPSHFSTAVFSTCDVKFWHFAVSTFLTLPKQIILVYLGVLLVEKKQNGNNTIKNVVFGATFVLTIALAVYIWVKMRRVKKMLLAEQEQRKMQQQIEMLPQKVEVDAVETEVIPLQPGMPGVAATRSDRPGYPQWI